mgnify:CR=1 FL=1
MALEKKVGTGFEGGHSYKSTWSTEGNTLLHNQLLESWGLKGESATVSNENYLVMGDANTTSDTEGAYTTNKGGKGVYYFNHNGNRIGFSRSIAKNNFEVVCAVSRDKVNTYTQNESGIIEISANSGVTQITGTFGDAGIKWSPDKSSNMTDVSSNDVWTAENYSVWHVKCVIADSTITSGNNSLFILSTGKAQTITNVIEYDDINTIESISFKSANGTRDYCIDDLTIWEDTSDANAKSEIDAIEAGTSSLQPHIRYIAPMADQTAYTTNGTTDDWTANSVDNETDLTDGSDSTFSEMTDNEGGLITNATDLSGTVAAAGYTVNTVESIAAAGFKVEDNEDNTFVGTLNSDGTGGGTTKTAVVAQGTTTPAYIRFDEADLTTEGITKTTTAATTFKLQ